MLIASLVLSSVLGAAGSCEDLARLSIPHSAITQAQMVAPGAFVQNAQDDRDTYKSLPAFCRVAATLTPTSDSDIKVEVWLPTAGWNGKYMAVGNGAFSGSIAYPAMAAALKRGYAVSSTDTGHTGNNARFGLGHPERVNDFAWRAVHEMTVTSKKVVDAFYSAPPKFSYWNGCSAGGRQAMKEAQRFPDDFDGIIAGSPGLDWTGRASQAMRVSTALEKNSAARLSPAQQEALHDAAIKACDRLDGLDDGLIGNPKACVFDPAVVQCRGTASGACLTPEQVATARLMYLSSIQPGSELGWTNLGWTNSARATGLDQFRYLVYADSNWDPQQFNFDKDRVAAQLKDNNNIDARDPDLSAFINRGGKLLHYHGWNDPQISPEDSTRYYESVVGKLGADKIRDSYRLFMAPGMGHCGGGEGPNTFDMVGVIEQWVEQKHAPDQIVAAKVENGVTRTRPLCPYPQVANWKGAGSIDDAANFACSAAQTPAKSKPDQRSSFQPEEVRITMERTPCFGPCPIYRIEIGGDGRVVYTGTRNVAEVGKREDRITQAQVAQIATAFLKARFFDTADKYDGDEVLIVRNGQYLRDRGMATDLSSVFLTFELGEQKKRVELRYEVPEDLIAIPALIDELTQSKRWTAPKQD